jgi:hypothetical protein
VIIFLLYKPLTTDVYGAPVKWSLMENTCTTTIPSASDSTWTNLGFKLWICCRKPVKIHLSYSIATLGQQLNLVSCRILLHASFQQLCCKPTAHVGISMCLSLLQYILSYFALHYQNTNNLYTGSQNMEFTNTCKTLCIITKWINLLTLIFD